MGTNDFEAASRCLDEDFELRWPQSAERIVGRSNFTALNSNYPADGPWRFEINRIVVDGNMVVSDVSVTDGRVEARAITFSTVRNGLITEQIEFWPEPYDAPPWRRAWTLPL